MKEGWRRSGNGDIFQTVSSHSDGTLRLWDSHHRSGLMWYERWGGGELPRSIPGKDEVRGERSKTRSLQFYEIRLFLLKEDVIPDLNGVRTNKSGGFRH